MNNQQKSAIKMATWFLKILVARIRSKSPKFYVTMRWIAGLLAFAAALLILAFKVNIFHVTAEVSANIVDWCKQIGAALSAVFLFTWTGTVDPELLNLPEDFEITNNNKPE